MTRDCSLGPDVAIYFAVDDTNGPWMGKNRRGRPAPRLIFPSRTPHQCVAVVRRDRMASERLRALAELKKVHQNDEMMIII